MEYAEREAAKANHYRWGDWITESPVLRAQMIAHEMHRGLREAWQMEQATAPKAAPESGMEGMRKRMGLR